MPDPVASPVNPPPAPAPAPGPMTVDSLAHLLHSASLAAPAPDPAGEADTGAQPDGSDSSPADDLPAGQPPADAAGGPPVDSHLEPDFPAEPEDAGAEDSPEDNAPTRRDQKTERRFAQLTAKLKQAQEELARLKGAPAAAGAPEPSSGRGTPAAPPPPRPSASEELEAQIAQVRSALGWIAQNPDGGEIEMNGKPVEVTAEQARAWATEWQDQLAELRVRRELEIQQRELRAEQARVRGVQEAARAYPWMQDPQSPLYAKAVEVLRTLPPAMVENLRRLPNSQSLLGALVTGLEAQRAAGPGLLAGARPPVRRPTPQPVNGGSGGGSGVPGGDPDEAGMKQGVTKFQSTGSLADLTNVLLAQQRSRARTAAAG